MGKYAWVPTDTALAEKRLEEKDKRIAKLERDINKLIAQLNLNEVGLPNPRHDRSLEFVRGYRHGGNCMRIAVTARLSRALGDKPTGVDRT